MNKSVHDYKSLKVNVFHPTKPNLGQEEVLKALDEGKRFVLLRAGRKWRKTSLMISWLFEKAFETGLSCHYVARYWGQASAVASTSRNHQSVVWETFVTSESRCLSVMQLFTSVIDPRIFGYLLNVKNLVRHTNKANNG